MCITMKKTGPRPATPPNEDRASTIVWTIYKEVPTHWPSNGDKEPSSNTSSDSEDTEDSSEL